MKYTLTILLSLLTIVTVFSQLNPQPSKMTNKFFVDPDIKINTPAFEKKRGFTDYDEMMIFLNELQSRFETEMKIDFIGQSQKGIEIPLVSLFKSESDSSKLRVWLQGGLHGNEPASTEGMLLLIKNLLEEDSLKYLREKLEFSIVPMANIDGMEKNDRYAANGLDLNRDQTKLMCPETVVLKSTFSKYNPHIAFDFHEYRPFRRDYARLSTYGVTVPYDVMFLYSGNLNVPESLRNFTNDLFIANARQVLDKKEFRHHDYFSSTKILSAIQFNQGSQNARSSASSYALANTVGGLIEIRGVGIARTSIVRRVYSTYLVATSFLKTAFENDTRVKTKLLESGLDNSEVIVKSKRKVYEDKINMIDVETNDFIEIDGIIRDAWLSQAILTRSLPESYILLPSQKSLVDKLEILGLEIQTLTETKNLEVEKFKVIKYYKSSEKYEGIFQQEVETEIIKENKSFPSGSYLLKTNQENVGLAVEVLEPEAPNSFVSFGLLETELGIELPIYRIVKNEK